jgi:hypothetical protein
VAKVTAGGYLDRPTGHHWPYAEGIRALAAPGNARTCRELDMEGARLIGERWPWPTECR